MVATYRDRLVTLVRLPGRWLGRVSGWVARRPALVGAWAALAISVAAIVPPRWRASLWHAAATLGWRWGPGLGIAVAITVLLTRRQDERRSRPPRWPLFAHVTVLLLVAASAAIVLALGVWWALGEPRLAGPASSLAPTPSGTLTPPAWTVSETFDAAKIVLALVAGIGGVVALAVAYRKQHHSEAAERREDTKLFNERFRGAADLLGSDKAAVRLAGVYATASLANDWNEGRQTCIDVLCAYLRMPPPTDASPAETPAPTRPGGRLRRALRAWRTRQDSPVSTDSTAIGGSGSRREADEERHVRHTILRLIRDHLRPDPDSGQRHWHRYAFDLTGAVIDSGDFSNIHLIEGTTLTLDEARFPSGNVSFDGATFSGGTASFDGATFSGGMVSFYGATFSGGDVAFTHATFSGSYVRFPHATFAGDVYFSHSKFSGSWVSFSDASFSGGQVRFNGASFTGGQVEFDDATLSGGILDFSTPNRWTVLPTGLDGSAPGVRWPSPEYLAELAEIPDHALY